MEGDAVVARPHHDRGIGDIWGIELRLRRAQQRAQVLDPIFGLGVGQTLGRIDVVLLEITSGDLGHALDRGNGDGIRVIARLHQNGLIDR
ncbi:MAG: hypothetical protein BRD57_03190 [Proteobacteria bacterium SW_6_67_9]|nr:MAG: hypothetical protein BRD57_03190 [Proteobacteria bacterium SW_6_67_9]